MSDQMCVLCTFTETAFLKGQLVQLAELEPAANVPLGKW
jgi:hypothetical protein